MFSFVNQSYYNKYHIKNNLLREYLKLNLQNYINNKSYEMKQNNLFIKY